MSDTRAFVKNNITVLASYILISLQGLLLTPILIKTAGITLYGGYVLLISMIGFIFGISTFGVGFRCKRFLPGIDDRQKRKALFFTQFTFQLISILLFSLLFIVLFPYIEVFFFKGDVSFIPWLVLPYLLLFTFYIQGADYFRYTHRMNIFNYATLTQPYLFIGLALLGYGITRQFTVDALLIANAVSALVVAVLLFRILVREIGFTLGFSSLKELLKNIKVGFPMVLNYMVDIILSMGDRYVIAAFMGVTAVGYYSPAYAIGAFVVFFAKASGVVLPPLMSRLVDREDEGTAVRMMDYTLKGYLLLAIPFIVGCALLAKPILTLYTNAELAEHAFLVMPIVALGSLFYGINIILSNVLFVRMETGVMFRVNVLAAVLNMILNLILLWYFRDIVMAAVTTAISYLVAFVYVSRKVRQIWEFDMQVLVIVKSIAASIMMAASLVWYLNVFSESSASIGVIGAAIMLGVVVYVVGLLLLKTFSRHEWHLLRKGLIA